ncbi:hypothetical protein LP7551_01318 [Roseibium album]|nr:hypothetical protein LP7551_01318 [Roseibium album]
MFGGGEIYKYYIDAANCDLLVPDLNASAVPMEKSGNFCMENQPSFRPYVSR